MRMRKCQKRPTIWQKSPIIRTKETYRYTGIPEVCASVKRDLFTGQKRPIDIKRPVDIERPLHAAKRPTDISMPMHHCQKRPTDMAKAAY